MVQGVRAELLPHGENASLWFWDILSHSSGEAQRLFEEPYTLPENVAFLVVRK